MAKVSFRSDETAPVVNALAGAVGQVETRAIFDGVQNPIHLYTHRLASGASLRFQGSPGDRLVFVWEGVARVETTKLESGSSAVVEFGAGMNILAEHTGAVLIEFRPQHHGSMTKSGGHIHLLPSERVPRTVSAPSITKLKGTSRVVGSTLHANAACPTCDVWFHENDFFGPDEVTTVHSHSVDEVIFVRAGSVKFGNRLYGPGSAVAIAANTKYGFSSGPEGLSFLNFRVGPSTYTSVDGSLTFDEAKFMTERHSALDYISWSADGPANTHLGQI